MKILFTNVGRRTYLVEYAVSLIKELNIEVFVSDTSYQVPGMWVSDQVRQIITPRVSDGPDDYICKLLNICCSHDIDLVIPLMDYELEVLSKHRDAFARESIVVACSDFNFIKSCLTKSSYKTVFSNLSSYFPKLWMEKEKVISNKPMFIMKPDSGSGSVGLKTLNTSASQLESVPDGMVVQELVAGQEYGMDIFNDLNGEFLHSCCRKKLAMRAGETDRAEVIYDELFWHLAQKLSAEFKHVGNLDLDFIQTESGDIYIIDLNPRFGGGYPFTHMAGFDYLKGLIKLSQGETVHYDRHGKNLIGMKGIKLFEMQLGS